jgi:hypothetical protein
MIDRTFRPVLGARRAARDDAAFERCAYLGPRAGADVYARALRDVVLPGFDELGVDLGPTRKLLADRDWQS